MSAESRHRTERRDPQRPPTPPRGEGGSPEAPSRGQVPETSQPDSRSVPQLLRELSSEATDLVQNEVALAKAEMKEKVDVFQRNLVAMTIGGAFLLAALLLFTWAVNTGLTALLAQFMDLEIAVWLSPLILAAVLGAVGWGMVKKAKDAIGDEGFAPRRTQETLEEDKEWAKSKARQMKEEVQHG